MPRNSEQNRKIKDERREQILSTGLRLFATKGLMATKIVDISRECAISQGLVYHYFKSKEEIFIELIKEGFEKLNFACRELEKLPVKPVEKIRTAITGLLENIESDEDAARMHLLIAQATVSEAIPESAKDTIRKNNGVPYDIIKKIIVEGQREGSIKRYPPEDLATLFWTTIKGLAIHRAVHWNAFKAPDTEIIMNMFVE